MLSTVWANAFSGDKLQAEEGRGQFWRVSTDFLFGWAQVGKEAAFVPPQPKIS